MFPRLSLSPRLRMGITMSTAMLMLACSAPAPASQSSEQPASQPGAPPAVANSAGSPAESSAASPTAATAAAPSTSSAQPVNSLRFVFEPGVSEMRYRARETFANQPTPVEAVGSTRQVSGAVLLTSDGAIVSDESKVVVDLSTLASDKGQRDNFIKQNTLQTAQYPTAELVLREVTDLLKPLPTMGEDTFQLLGDLTVHGVTRPTAWDVQAHFNPDEVAGTATTRVKITDFGMQTPRTAAILSVEDEIRLELDFHAKRS